VLETRSDLVTSCMRSPYGRDLITIGYAGLVHLRSRDDLAGNPQDRLLDLLAPPRPRWRERLRQDPLRTIGFMVGDASMRHDFRRRMARRLGISSPPRATEPGLYAIGDWASLSTVAE
jgi:hypothetical protein